MVKKLATYITILFSTLNYAQEVEIKPFPTKLKGDVYAPAFFKDQIIVCSNQKDRFIKTVIDQQGTEPSDLYIIGDSIGNYERFDETFRTNYNDGPVSFNEEGNYLIISRNIKTDQNVGLFQTTSNNLGLYESNSDYYGWNKPKLLPFVDTAYHYTHPSLNAEGNRLMFTSNRPGGFGGFDIWISYKDGDNWSDPVNAGKEINTKNDELFPSQDAGLVYFASNRKGIGNLDIYVLNENAHILELLPEPINSKADDFGLIAKDKMREGYLTSNRDGADQLYQFKYDRPDFEDCDSIVPNTLCFTLYEENARDLGEVGNLIYEWHINDTTLQGISVDYCFPGAGDYEITLDIIDTVIHKTYFNQSYYFLSLQIEEQPYITSPDTVFIGDEVELSADETNLPGVEISEYVWSVNEGNSFFGNRSKYVFKETGIHQLQLGVKGKRGDEEVTECVFKSVVAIDKNSGVQINDKRVEALKDSSLVKEVVHFYEQENDSSVIVYSIEVIRSDEKIADEDIIYGLMEKYGDVKLQYVENDSQYSYLIGQWETINEAYPTWQEMIVDGYDNAIVRSVDVNKVANFQFDEVFVMNNVQFDEDSWDIREEAVADLQNIVSVMTLFPDIKLVIVAHTDTRGEDEYNKELSEKRAASVKEYLVSFGVSADRITDEGHGAEEPLTEEKTPEAHAKNRRVEFKFVK